MTAPSATVECGRTASPEGDTATQAAGSKTFVIAAEIRIQSYLQRTPKLAAMRGASLMLREATADRGDIDLSGLGGFRLLNPPSASSGGDPLTREGTSATASGPQGSVANGDVARRFRELLAQREAEGTLRSPPIDGVIELVSDQVEPEEVCAAAADRLRDHLRSRLPAADLVASWAYGNNLAEVHRDLHDLTRPHTIISPAPLVDFPPVKSCALCQTAAAVCTREEPGDEDSDGRTGPQLGSGKPTVEVCLDCCLRLEHARGREQRAAVASWIEGSPSDYRSLASLGADTFENRVAVISADGNSLGAFFAGVATNPAARSAKAATSLAIRLAVEHATTVVAGQLQVHKGNSTERALIPHIVGGDDVLIAVPGSYGLQAATLLIETFGETMSQLCEVISTTYGPDAATYLSDRRPPTLSAGVAIIGKNFPAAVAMDIAGGLLDRAKSLGRADASDSVGEDARLREARMAWADVNNYDPDNDEPHGWSLSDLDRHRPFLDAMGMLGAEGQARSALYMLDDEYQQADNIEDPVARRRRLERVANRNPTIRHALESTGVQRKPERNVSVWDWPEDAAVALSMIRGGRWWHQLPSSPRPEDES